MGIKRYVASKDNTITNAFKSNLSTRATDANMGASDILETFSIYGQSTTSSAEAQRILIQFPIDAISKDRTSKNIPASGSVSFYLRMFNAVHGQPLPRDLVLSARPLTKIWDEGPGLDMDSYSDEGYPLVTGSTWHTSSANVKWTTPGGDVSLTAADNYTDSFEKGTENLEINISHLVEQWIAGSKTNYGLLVQVSSSQEAFVQAGIANTISQNITGSKKSYYTKKFHGRTSEFFFRRPIIEARWDFNRIKDDRGKAHYSSSLLRTTDNLNTLYLYNYVGGKLRNIPYLTDQLIYVQLFSGSLGNTVPQGAALTMTAPAGGVASGVPTVITGGLVSGEVGIYTASFALTSNVPPVKVLTDVFDVWMMGDGSGALTTQYYTGSFKIEKSSALEYSFTPEYVTKITNLKHSYDHGEIAKLRVFNRLKNWQPNVYTVANSTPENTIIESGSYRVYRVRDNLEVIRHSTASSDNETYLSYDKNGNFFDLDTSMLEPGYMYGLELAYYIGDTWNIQKNKFKFRVDEREQV